MRFIVFLYEIDRVITTIYHYNLKTSVCVNGVSLTVVDSAQDFFSVAIIPFTWEHTGFHTMKEGDSVNLEFDILGKYMRKMLAARLPL